MKIAILDLVRHGAILEGLERTGPQVAAWLRRGLPEADIAIHDVGDGAALPTPGSFDGLVLSGSEAGVYDDRPWMAALRQLLLDCRAMRMPVFGICFGHQIMADTWGGRAELANAGNVVGARRFTGEAGAVDAMFWHQDQVTAVPPGARVTGSSPHCPVGALAYDFPALSVQFHPEYSENSLRGMFARGRGVFIDDATIEAAEASFEGADVARDLMAEQAAAFFRRCVRSV